MVTRIHIILFACVASLVPSISALEYVQHVHSDITVNTDASLTITETITYTNIDMPKKHGIKRFIPIQYTGPYNTEYTIGLSIDQILRDGEPTPHDIQQKNGFLSIHIGDPDTYLSPGTYTYTITYTTYRQLGFFPHHDELYWNIIGTQWELSIRNSSATIHLPQEIPSDMIHATAYIGQYLDEDSHTLTPTINRDNNTITLSTNRTLPPGHGLTISMQWPKGYIAEPTQHQELMYFINDNWVLLVSITFLILLILYYISVYYYVRRTEEREAVIPQFHPPEDTSPGGAGYVLTRQYKPQQMGAEIVNMGVYQYITIEYQKGFTGGSYTLHRTDKNQIDNTIFRMLDRYLFFKNTKSVNINKEEKRITNAVKSIQGLYQSQYDQYFRNNYHLSVIVPLFVIAPIYVLVCLFPPDLGPYTFHPQLIATENLSFHVILAAYVMSLYAIDWIRGYTYEGLQLCNHIRGFKMFLEATEKHRIHITGTPPEKTPELYETYLPYAIALGVEKQWSKQFTHVFKEIPYRPRWYRGHAPSNIGKFSTHLSKSLQSAVTTAGTGGSKGRSGGGRGGGGGGSW